MQLIAPSQVDQCRPFRIGAGPSGTGPRLGGTAPLNVSSPLLRPCAQYFITFPIATQPDLDASLFVNCTFDEFIEAMNKGFQRDDRIVLIVHPPTPRGKDPLYASVNTPHPLILGDVEDDLEEEDEELIPNSHHKFGGRPFCIYEPELPGAEILLEAGYTQVVQIDFPSRAQGDALPGGNWPFMDGVFNVFWKPPLEGVPYYWYLQK